MIVCRWGVMGFDYFKGQENPRRWINGPLIDICEFTHPRQLTLILSAELSCRLYRRSWVTAFELLPVVSVNRRPDPYRTPDAIYWPTIQHSNGNTLSMGSKIRKVFW